MHGGEDQKAGRSTSQPRALLSPPRTQRNETSHTKTANKPAPVYRTRMINTCDSYTAICRTYLASTALGESEHACYQNKFAQERGEVA